MPGDVKDHALECFSDDEATLMEDRLWWMTGRKAIIRRYLEIGIIEREKARIMDIGCGSGENLSVLREFGEVTGMEPSPVLAQRARRRGMAKAVYEEDHIAEEVAKTMTLFTMFDVLEHIEDDRSFLASLAQRTPQPHRLLVSVPACPSLYGEHDRLLHHYRRYNRKMLTGALKSAGYEVLQMSYHLAFLFPLAIATRMKDQVLAFCGLKRTKVSLGNVPEPISTAFAAILSAESIFVGRINLPFGLWLFALAETSQRKQGGDV